MFINVHTHSQLYDAKIELVNLAIDATDKPNYYSYGLHPCHINKESCYDVLERLEIIATEKRCLAIGKCGLDKLAETDFDLQQEIFVEQIKIANRIKKPLIVYCVKAFNELMNCLRLNDNEMPVIIQGYNHSENIAQVLMSENCLFSFGKALLGYESNAAKTLINVGRKNFFLETDDADISIKYIYKKAAELLGIEETILQAQLQSNFENVFKLKL